MISMPFAGVRSVAFRASTDQPSVAAVFVVGALAPRASSGRRGAEAPTTNMRLLLWSARDVSRDLGGAQ